MAYKIKQGEVEVLKAWVAGIKETHDLSPRTHEILIIFNQTSEHRSGLANRILIGVDSDEDEPVGDLTIAENYWLTTRSVKVLDALFEVLPALSKNVYPTETITIELRCNGTTCGQPALVIEVEKVDA